MSESDLYPEILLEATRLGHRLFRNNRGKGKYTRRDGTEGFVPFGLCEGASDLVGWTMCYCGETDEKTPVFTAVEAKMPGARTDKKLLKQQTDFIEAVKAAGGIAGFVTSIADYRALVGAE